MSNRRNRRSQRPAPRRASGPEPFTPERRPAPPPTRRPAPPPSFVDKYRFQLVAGVVVVMLVAIAVIAVLKFGPSDNNSANAGIAASNTPDPSLIAAVTKVPAATFDAVGAGSATNPPKALTGVSPVTKDGKPQLLYVGGEFCPFCAAQRWALITALSRFGSFAGLLTTRSAVNDGNFVTFTFRGATYTSQYLAFAPVETTDRDHKPLQKLDDQQSKLFNTYDAPPYVPAQSLGSIPFMLFSGKYYVSGAMVDTNVLTNKTWSDVAAALSNPGSAEAKSILGSANVMTAALCQLTNGQPGDVCTSSGVQKGAAQLPKAS